MSERTAGSAHPPDDNAFTRSLPAVVLTFALLVPLAACDESPITDTAPLMTAGIIVKGQVVDSAGRPVSYMTDTARVTALSSHQCDEDGHLWQGSQRLDDDGRYEVGHGIIPSLMPVERCVYLEVTDFIRTDTFGGVEATARSRSEGRDTITINAVFQPARD